VLAGRREDVGEILTRVNGVLAEDVGNERFVTLFLARLDARARTFTYASAGHPTGYILDAAGQVKRTLPRTGVPLGLRPDTKYDSSPEIALETGDLVLLLTDGIEESISLDNTIFGIERVLDVVRTVREKSAFEIVTALYESVRQFTKNSPQLDDITTIVIKVKDVA
jgi:sigma-B regulation protein RsbU (phosphoserine phosphatase)